MRRLAWLLLVPLLTLARPAFSTETKAIFTKRCAHCHGDDGTGHTKFARKHKVPDFSSPRFQHHNSDAKLEKAIGYGVKGSKMPAFKGKLSPQEIRGLVAYIRSLQHG